MPDIIGDVVDQILAEWWNIPKQGQLTIAESNYSYLNSQQAVFDYPVPADLVYLRKVWSRVLERVRDLTDDDEDDTL